MIAVFWMLARWMIKSFKTFFKPYLYLITQAMSFCTKARWGFCSTRADGIWLLLFDFSGTLVTMRNEKQIHPCDACTKERIAASHFQIIINTEIV